MKMHSKGTNISVNNLPSNDHLVTDLFVESSFSLLGFILILLLLA